MGSDLTYPGVKEALRDVLHRQDMDSLLAIGWDLIEAFFIGGLLLTILMTPLTYYAVKFAVIRYRSLREKLKARRAEMKGKTQMHKTINKKQGRSCPEEPEQK